MPDVQVRRGRDIVLVSEADIAVLNGLDHEIERHQRHVEEAAGEGVELPRRTRYHLTQGRDAEMLSRYHPHRSYPRKALLQLERAGLANRKRDRYGQSWGVTAAGDALLEERDDLPGLLCWECWEEAACAPFEVETKVDRFEMARLADLCPSCILDAVEAAKASASLRVEQARRNQDRIVTYAGEVAEALSAQPDE